MGNWPLLAMTASRAEVIREIAADALFSEDPERSLDYTRALVWRRVRQVLGDDTTSEELFRVCCDEPEAERTGRTKP